MDLTFELLNVFGIEGDPFSGNPLCVFTEAAQVSDGDMQAWARQFNLSETTFLTEHDVAGEAKVRIFTPRHEMPFAGHPSLGTADVVAGLVGAGCDRVHLTMPAGRVPLERVEGGWRLRALPSTTRPAGMRVDDIAAALGIEEHVVVGPDASWVDSGVEQLLVRLDSVAAVRACAPDAALVSRVLGPARHGADVFVWAWTGPMTVEARFFFTQDASLVEDPATGSAGANLGGWLAQRGARDISVDVSQGAGVGRPSRLRLEIDSDGAVHVGGRVDRVGAGTVTHGPSDASDVVAALTGGV